MKLATDGGKRTVPPCTSWAVVDLDTNERWSGILDPDFTSNQAEYHALIQAIEIARIRGTEILLIQMDSELVVRHVSGQYKCRDAKLQPLLQQVHELLVPFKNNWSIFHVPRERNALADEEVNLAMDRHLGLTIK